MAEQPEERRGAGSGLRLCSSPGVRAGDAARDRDAAPARDGSQSSFPGGAGIRPEAPGPPATGSLTGEGLRPFRALRRGHPTWGLASGCGERTRPETKSAAPVAEQTPHDEVRSFLRKGRAERRKACVLRKKCAPHSHECGTTTLRLRRSVAPHACRNAGRGQQETAGDPRAVNNRGASARLRAGKGCVPARGVGRYARLRGRDSSACRQTRARIPAR